MVPHFPRPGNTFEYFDNSQDSHTYNRLRKGNKIKTMNIKRSLFYIYICFLEYTEKKNANKSKLKRLYAESNGKNIYF